MRPRGFLREPGSNRAIRADEIVRRMLANGCSVADLTMNSLYSTVGVDMRARQEKCAPQRFDRPGMAKLRKPSDWTISLASVVTEAEHPGPENHAQVPEPDVQ